MKPIQFALRASAAGALALAMAASANAATQQLTVTVENLSAANGYATGPLQVGFGNGSFDAFNIGSVASAAIVPVAELGSGSAWQPAFAAADPGAVIGAIGGVLLPSGSASATFTVNTANNSYFSFGAMVVPSNDFFIGNDSPTAYRLFDAAGKLTTASITLKATDIWDAGSEVFDPASAAFVGNANQVWQGVGAQLLKRALSVQLDGSQGNAELLRNGWIGMPRRHPAGGTAGADARARRSRRVLPA